MRPKKIAPLDALGAVLGVFYSVLIGAAIAFLSAPLVSPSLAAAQRVGKATPLACIAICGLGAIIALAGVCSVLSLVATIDDSDVFASNSELVGYLRWFALGGPVAGYIYWRLEQVSAHSGGADAAHITRPS